MWRALELVAGRVKPGGILFVALYNDQGWISTYWLKTKMLYNLHPFFRYITVVLNFPYLWLARAAVRVVTRRAQVRGMSLWYDMHDWLGGLPFEVAERQAVVEFCELRGLFLRRQKSVGNRQGCNQFVFTKPL
jgi:hypothetical protein